MVDYLETHEGTSRLEGFSNGVLSISATLLAWDSGCHDRSRALRICWWR